MVGTSTVALLATLTPATTVLAAEATDAERAAEAVVSLAVALDQLSLTPELGTPLPLMLQSPADLLGFPALFSTDVAGPVQTQLLDNTTSEDTAALETALTSGSVLGGGTAVTTDDDVVTVTLDVNHQVTDATVPIAYIREADETDPDADPAIAIVGSDTAGSLTGVTATLTGTITLTVDPSVVQADGTTYDPLAAASIEPASQLAVTVAKANGDVTFSAAYGFTEVDVTGTGSIDLGLDVDLNDPDGDGAITRGEWESTLFDDLATVSTAGTSTDEVAVTLALEAVEVTGLDLGTNPPAGTITYADDLGATGWPDTTTVTVDDALADFATVSVEDALSALAQFGTAIQGAQNRVDQKLPFVDTRFSDAGSPADDLMTLVERQGAAAVVCGRLDTVPPMGTFLSGTTWYCQAFTTQDPATGTVQWSVDGVALLGADAKADTTVGTAPTTTVEVTSATVPDVSVTFEVDGETTEGGGAVTITADRRFRTVQDLHAALADTVTTTATTYDDTTDTLQFALDDTTAATTFDAPLAIDDLLRTEARLAGVEHEDGPDGAGDDPKVVRVSVGEVVLDAGFGLVLGDDADVPDDDADATTETPRSARYLFLPGADAELSVASLTASLPEAEELVARIGYLPVTIDLAAGAGDLGVSNPTTGVDALAVQVPVAVDGLTVGGSTLTATRLADVLQAKDGHGATATFNLAGALSLDVDLADGLSITNYTDGAGTVDVAWPYDSAAGRRIQDLAYTYDAGGVFEDLLKPFDLSPTLTGTHDRTATSAATTLTDPAVDFSTAFGFDPATDVLPLTLFNLTSGASCTNVRVYASDANGHTLECVSIDENGAVAPATLFGSQRLDSNEDPDNTWQAGDLWEIRGDPTLLRGVVLDALNNLANQLDLVDDPTHTAPLPLVGLPPKAFGPQFAEARDAIAEVAARPELQVTKVTGTVASVSATGSTVTVPGTDDLSGLDLGVTVTNTTTGASCPVTAATATTFDCVLTTGSWTAADTWSFTASVDPADASPPDLAALVTVLEAALNAQPSITGATVDLALESLDSPYDSGTEATHHLVVDVTLPGAGTLEAPIRVDFGEDPAADLLRSPIDPAADTVLEVDWESTARLDIGIPWDPTVPLEQITVLASTGLEDATATADSIDAELPIDTTGSFGPLGLVIGESADLEGTHTLPAGTHTGDPVASGTSETITGTVTAIGGTGQSQTITDADRDFDELGVPTTGAVIRNTTDGWDCAITAVADDTLTCEAPAIPETADPVQYETWAVDDTYAITTGHPDDRVIDLDGDDITAEVAEGDLLVNTGGEDETSCVLEAAGITEHTLSCGITVAPDDTWEVRSRTVLQDSARTGEDAVGFDELLGLLDPTDELPAGVTVTVQRTDGGTCEVTDADDVTADTLTCTDGLEASDGTGTGWATEDAYTIALTGTTDADVVIDVGRDFHRMGIVGATLVKGTTETGPDCAITEARQHLLVCADGLGPTADLADGDAYLIPGTGIARFELGDYDLVGIGSGVLADPDPGGTGSITPYTDTVAGGLMGATTDPICEEGEAGEEGDLPTTWAGDACAVLSVGVLDDPETADVDEYRYLGIVKWESTIEGEATGTTSPLLPDALTGAVEADEPLQWSLLSLAFGQVKALVRDALEDSLVYEEFPLIGADVSAGTHLEQAIDELEAAAAASAPAELTATSTIPQVQSGIETWVTGLLGGEDGLQVGDVTLMETYAVTVTLACKGLNEPNEIPCRDTGEDQHVGGDIARVQIDLAVGDNLQVTTEKTATRPVLDTNGVCTNCGTTTYDLGFDLGLDGLPFDASSDFELQSKAAWSINVGVGLSRDEGPYLVVGTDPTAPTVDVYADVSFPTDAGCPTLPAFARGYAADRCARLNIGYFQGMVFDGNGTETDIDPTALRFEFAADVSEAASGDGLLSLSDLVSGTAPTASLSADADANLDLYFVTGADFSGLIGEGVEGLPSVEGALHASFDVNGGLNSLTGSTTGWQGELVYDGLILNLGSFVQNFLSPIAGEINVYVKPLKPIIDLVRAPIPVLSDIARAVGKPPVTVLTVINEAGFDTTLVERVLDAIALAADLVEIADKGYIGLGGSEEKQGWDLPVIDGVTAPELSGMTGKFSVSPKQKRTGPCGKTDDQGNKQPKDCKGAYNKGGTKQTTTVKQYAECGSDGQKPCTGKEMTRTVTTTLQKPRLTGMGLSFPILDDATQVFWMILGEAEPVLVRFDAGTLAASAGVSVSFGPFMAGPVPVDVTLGASFDFSARFAMGYDVRGIINALKQDPDDFDPSALMDGLFIDDLDANGTDVPEIVVSVTATVGAAVSVKIFKVGLEGGVTIAVEFNLKDPDLDGKLRLDEIRRVAAANPLCIFEVRGTLTFFVNVFVSVDLFVKTLKYSITLFKLKPPIELFKVECKTPPPALARPAQPQSSPTTSATWDLRLLMGSQTLRDARWYATTEEKEKFTIRQLSTEGAASGPADFRSTPDDTSDDVALTGGTKVSVEAFGLYQEFLVPAGGKIIADGDSAIDTIRFEPGTAENGDEIPFTLDVDVSGGAGNDRISTGGGDDVVAGNAGNDTIATGDGDDTVTGGAGNDDITGGRGDDDIDGGAGNDRLSGDAGDDVVEGGSGDDDVSGGPGLDPDATPVGDEDLTDGDDVLIGGDGNDTLRGHFGDDVVFGDGTTLAWTAGNADAHTATAACGSATGTGADTIVGEAGDDVLIGGGGDDDVTGGRGSDHLCGNGGDDVLDGDAPNLAADASDQRADTIFGDAGDDRLYGREGDDVLDGGADDDLVEGGTGHDRLLGGTGADALVGGDGNDVVAGDDGTITTGLDKDSNTGTDAEVTGTDPDGTTEAAPTVPIVCADRVSVRGGLVDLNSDGSIDAADSGRAGGFAVVSGQVDLDGDSVVDDADDTGLFADLPVVAGKVQAADGYVFVAAMGVLGDGDCILGGQGHDALVGGPGHDVVFGDVGNDYLQGDSGDDVLRGAQQDDEVRGGAGADLIHGDSGVDHLYGDGLDSGTDDGTDEIHGGTGDDRIEGNAGADELYGDDGADTMIGGSSDDGVPGGSGAGEADGGDVVLGGPGDDLVAGDNANPVEDAGAFVGVELLDLPDVDDDAPDATLSGADDLRGGGGDDRIYGQGGDDVIHGEDGADTVDGNDGQDEIHGGGGADHLVGGSSRDLGGASGAERRLDHLRDAGDTIRGDAGADVIAGDNAVVEADGTVTLADLGIVGLDLADTDTADAYAAASGGDDLGGGDGHDTLFGQGGDDLVTGDAGADHVEGNDGDDTLHGGADDDVLVGGTTNQASLLTFDAAATTSFGKALDGDDTLHGDGGDDVLLGDDVSLAGTVPSVTFDLTVGVADGVDGDDTLHGGTGDDRLWGQRGDDVLHGDAGHDLLLGDLATVEPDGSTPWPGGAPRWDVDLVDPDEGGEDELYGGTQDDRLYGGAADDVLEGGLGDDHLEGNGGADELYGHSADFATAVPESQLLALATDAGSDQDDLVGGSSSVHPDAATTGAKDAGDHLVGDAGQDVLIGDNGEITREPAGEAWATDEITGGHSRVVELFDRERTEASTLPLSEVSGDDTLFGSGGNDRLFGQGGDDHLRGETGEDQLQGNQGSDWLAGNDGDDDLIGGSDTDDGGVGEYDAGDWLHGGEGDDVITGDNARIVREAVDAPYLTTHDRFAGFDTDRWILLHDLDAPADTSRSGEDVVVGGSGADLVFGQDGADRIFGASGDDYAEGNGGADLLVGDQVPDDVLATGAAIAGSAVVTGFGDAMEVPDSLVALDTRLLSEFAIAVSSDLERDGDQSEGDGQDDLVGGSSIPGHRDGDDTVLGDGAQDFLLGDNAAVVRHLEEDTGTYLRYGDSGDPDRIVRVTERHDVGEGAGTSGADLLLGGDADDALWGQDGDDELWGEDGDDDLFGELGDDDLFGGTGEDALVGDRGGVVNTALEEANTGADGDFASTTFATSSPPFLTYTSFLHAVDRRVDLQVERVGSVGGPLEADRPLGDMNGVDEGGDDLLRGGPDRDALHGGAGDDIMNGDSGGDVLFGYDGADVMWGGRGNPDAADPHARGTDDAFVDHLFGGRGGTGTEGLIVDGADVLDYRPRTLDDTGGAIADPDTWHAAVDPYTDLEGEAVETLRQHNHGVDWMYGGWDRDVMQANLAEAGPNDGDRLIDWSGAYNLYTHCSQDYGGFNDQRTSSPTMVDFLTQLAYVNGVGTSLADVGASSSSAYNALAMVYRPDMKSNSGKAYPNTPGHGTTTACAPEDDTTTTGAGS